MANKWWHYWIPGYGQYLAVRDAIKEKDLFAGAKHSLGLGLNNEEQDLSAQRILGEVSNQAREEYLEDRAHTEMREDTAYQRGVEDMRRAGLNPYTIGSSPSSSSSSNVGENTITAKLQMLGYVLDLKNLDLKNKQVANQAIGNVIKALK